MVLGGGEFFPPPHRRGSLVCTSPLIPLPLHNHYFILHATYFILHATSFLSALCKFSLHSHTHILVICLISVLHISFLRLMIISTHFKYFSYPCKSFCTFRLVPKFMSLRVVPESCLSPSWSRPSCFSAVFPASLLIPYSLCLTYWCSEVSWTHNDPVLTSLNSPSHSITPPRRPSPRPAPPPSPLHSSVLHTPRRTPAHLQ